MKRPGLLQGIIVAVLLSLAAPAVHYLVDLLVPRMLALKLVMAVLTTAYVFYLLRLHHARIGNIVLGTGTALILIAALLWEHGDEHLGLRQHHPHLDRALAHHLFQCVHEHP